jgi:hypothetical protein
MIHEEIIGFDSVGFVDLDFHFRSQLKFGRHGSWSVFVQRRKIFERNVHLGMVDDQRTRVPLTSMAVSVSRLALHRLQKIFIQVREQAMGRDGAV